ncbi:hypothetical protein [Paragemmobacter straminiformis]|uniref:Uncharacterized protein n=1 Tax=Paragemmobacter straminiformis TaxID=2045119 RepID=A0A842I819_9RHOB|nr:hypothetical protein [Gemmobacter straminiformis]MBC2835138.1 hypothetical protein [Gemmobacter straminiformis]
MSGDRGLGRHGRRSTGPKTAAGKAICARNARRHGLTRFEPDPEQVRELSLAVMAHFGLDEGRRTLATCLADAELRIQHVQRVISRSFLEGRGPRFSVGAAERYFAEAQTRHRDALDELTGAVEERNDK